MKIRILLVLMLGCGCATLAPAPAPKTSMSEAFGSTAPEAREAPEPRTHPTTATRAPVADVNPERWARQFQVPWMCEEAARAMANRAEGWKYLKACTTRNDFGMLQSLIDHWSEELRTKPEAASVVAQVVANRGGLVQADIKLLQDHRVPIFELNSALAQPRAFKGRYLVVVGRIERLQSNHSRSEVVLMAMTREDTESSVFTAGTTSGTVSSTSGSGSANFRSTVFGTGSVSGRYNSTTATQSGRTEVRSESTFRDTNQTLIARIAKPDPFLAVDRTFVFLVRFDGARQTEDESEEEGESTALVSVISYHEIGSGGTVGW